MDIKHRTAYARLKVQGVAQEILVNGGMSIAMLMRELTMTIADAPNRYDGLTIEIDFKPFGETRTSQETAFKEMFAGLDLSDVELVSEDDPAIARWQRSPQNPESPEFDALYREYIMCGSSNHRAAKTPEDLNLLRRHVERAYAGTEWWDGSHRW
jgi:hypothetical protein